MSSPIRKKRKEEVEEEEEPEIRKFKRQQSEKNARIIEAKQIAKKENFNEKYIHCVDEATKIVALKVYCNCIGVRYKIRKNKAICPNASCNGEISFWGNVGGYGFILKSITPHTCISATTSSTSTKKRRSGNAAYSAKFISDEVGDLLKYNPKICAVDLQHIFAKYINGVFKSKQYETIVRNGRNNWLKINYGPKNWDYFRGCTYIARIIKELDCDNVVDVESINVNGRCCYKRMVVIPGAFIRAMPYLQNVRSADAAHMNGIGENNPLGKLYNFVAKDGNGNTHIAIGHGGNESTIEWEYFFSYFLSYLFLFGCSLITDQMGGILNAIITVQEYFDANEGKQVDKNGNDITNTWWYGRSSRYFYCKSSDRLKHWSACVTHKTGNLKTRYGKDISELYKKYHSCNTEVQYQSFVDELAMATADWSRLDKLDIKEYLLDKSDFYFRFKVQQQAGSRCGQVSSQGSEVSNKVSGGRNPDGFGFARYKHPLLMVATTYNWYISFLKRNYEELSQITTTLTPYATAKLKAITKNSKNVTIHPYTTCNTRVATTLTTDEDGTQRVHEVRLEARSCDCNLPYETLMPCKHMVAVVRLINEKRPPERKLNIHSYFNNLWTMKNYMDMANAIKINELKLLDIDDIINHINDDIANEKPNDGIIRLKSPVEYVKGGLPIYHLEHFKDAKQKKLSKPGPKPHKRMGGGAGEGMSTA